MRDPDAGRLRRYMNSRARGQPHHEYVRYDSSLDALLLCDERTARAHERWRRIRHPGQPWCLVLGVNVTIASDTALQVFFETIGLEQWRSLDLAVRRSASRCLREWRALGDCLIAAVRAVAEGHSGAASLQLAFEAGQRSALFSSTGVKRSSAVASQAEPQASSSVKRAIRSPEMPARGAQHKR